MKAAVALLAALGFVACVSAGSYGGVGVRTAPAYNYMQYQARPMYYAMRQPMYYGVQQGGGSGSGNLLGGSGNMFGAGGYGGGGSDMGSVLPILLVCKYIFPNSVGRGGDTTFSQPQPPPFEIFPHSSPVLSAFSN